MINGKAQDSRGDFIASERDDVLVQGIAGEANSLGYFGFAFFEESQDILRAVAIDGGAGCVTPNRETIEDGTYTNLSRPLFIYVNQVAAEQDYVKDFVRFHLGEESRELVNEVNYVSFPAQVYKLALARFEKGLTGTLFGGDSPQEGTVVEILAANQ